jgi:hypothetical protein
MESKKLAVTVEQINEMVADNTITTIAYTTAIPFNHILTDIADHILTDNDTFTINTTDAADNCGAMLRLTNNGVYTPVLTVFHVSGSYDNTKTYSLLTFIRQRGQYICAIQNYN